MQKLLHRFEQYHEIIIYKIIYKNITQKMTIMNK